MSESTEAFQCQDCSQLIQYHAGLNRVVNMVNGPGGLKGQDHVCPKRVGSKFHHIEPKGINYWNHKHGPNGDCIHNVPLWVKNHYYSITRLGVCVVEECPCHAIDAMKDPEIKKQSDLEREAWIVKYGK